MSILEIVRAVRQRRQTLAPLVAEVEAGRLGRLVLYSAVPGVKAVVSRSLSAGMAVRLTRFEGEVPTGHVEYRSGEVEQVLRDLAGYAPS
ncbi:hypothetical protein [Methylorubrum thiocyanatum]|uniref:hypothetical protein n=1 Tax=Methylorubrum thiocyanatum TaxID=47958 RepID=UPI00398C3DB3